MLSCSPKSRFLRDLTALSFATACTAAMASAQSTPRLLADFGGPLPGGGNLNSIGELADLNGILFFTGHDRNAGQELWRSDGTLAGTRQVKDIVPGFGSSFPQKLTAAGNQVFFFASDLEAGYRLWKSDATEQGTIPLATIAGGDEGRLPYQMIAAGNKLLFAVPDAAESAVSVLWVSDGTAEGTHELTAGGQALDKLDYYGLQAFGDDVIFLANGDLWRSDGTDQGTRVIVSDAEPYFGITVAGGKIYLHGDELLVSDGNPGPAVVPEFLDERFDGYYIEASGVAARGDFLTLRVGKEETGTNRIWITDGTKRGTHLLDDTFDRAPDLYFDWGGATLRGRHYLSIATEKTGYELWMTNGTRKGTRMVKDLVRGRDSSSPEDFVTAGKLVYFCATTPQYGEELWTTAGSRFSTRPLRDMNRGQAGSEPRMMTASGNRLFWIADDGESGRQLWTTKGTSKSTTRLTSLSPGIFSPSISGIRRPGDGSAVGLNGIYYFPAGKLSETVTAAWRSDSTTVGTVRMYSPDSNGAGSFPRNFKASGNRVYYHSWGPFGDGLFWCVQGTDTPVREPVFYIDYFRDRGWRPEVLGELGGHTILTLRHNGLFQEGLWLHAPDSDRAENPSEGDAPPGPPGEQVFFSNYSTFHGHEPWGTDGTYEGTRMIRDVRTNTIYDPSPSPASSSPEFIGKAGGKTCFVADSFGRGRELWITDGTLAGTTFLYDFTSGYGSTKFSKAYSWGSKLLFFTRSEFYAGNSVLWITDGTQEGTHPLLNEGAAGEWLLPFENPGGMFAELGGKLLFTADIGELGQELWSTDGTREGTQLVKDIAPGSIASKPEWLTATGNAVYFNADDGRHGRELWRSDGTAAGTVMVSDPTQDRASSSPWGLSFTGGKLFYMAATRFNGTAPHVIDQP